MQTIASQSRRLIACILLPAYLAACSTWTTQEVSPQQVIGEEQPDMVRVTLTDGSQVEVYQPRVSGDTLMGLREGQQVSIPLASVTQLELREGDTGKSIAAAGIVVGVGALLVGGFFIWCAQSEECLKT